MTVQHELLSLRAAIVELRRQRDDETDERVKAFIRGLLSGYVRSAQMLLRLRREGYQ